MNSLQDILEDQRVYQNHWIFWEKDHFTVLQKPPKSKQNNRETLARLYMECVQAMQKKADLSFEQASCRVRRVWKEEIVLQRDKSLPGIIAEDGFLCLYALGKACRFVWLRKIWQKISAPLSEEEIHLSPIYIGWNDPAIHYFDVDATPPGLSKFFPTLRLKKDKELLFNIAQDLEHVSATADPKMRMLLSLSILSHGAAYRELDGYQIKLPSFSERGKLIPYLCHQHLIAEGVKTVSLIPQVSDATPIYLCQGTEFWPSQPSMLGSILANFAEHGSATEAYAHSWRRIHQQLRALGKPLVAGHSMGGALALQIGLYSHELVSGIYAFNPPVPNERDYLFYHQMSEESKQNIHVYANLDDFAFWRIGSKVIGDVTLFLGKKRWKYYSVGLWDCICLLPAFVKFIRNVHHAFPAHQRIASLYANWVSVKLTQEEIEKENRERVSRFDYLHFLPKLYDPAKVLLTHVRKIFKWRLQEEYLRNEIEIIALHERDLLDTLNETNKAEIEKELSELRNQKNTLLQRLNKPLK